MLGGRLSLINAARPRCKGDETNRGICPPFVLQRLGAGTLRRQSFCTAIKPAAAS